MSRWIKVFAPLAITAVLVSVVAIGFPSPSSEAACMGDGPETSATHGRANSTDTYPFDFCSDSTLMLVVSLQWDNGNKNLDLRVTEPNGTQHTVNGVTGTSEHYIHRAPLPEGSWTIEVINTGKGAVAYGLSVTFMADPDA